MFLPTKILPNGVGLVKWTQIIILLQIQSESLRNFEVGYVSNVILKIYLLAFDIKTQATKKMHSWGSIGVRLDAYV